MPPILLEELVAAGEPEPEPTVTPEPTDQSEAPAPATADPPLTRDDFRPRGCPASK